ncbi:MAG: hypothetical protein NC132_02595 [Corallococcus sp.]|nr:hypothetical protein [Corallococcus sp.]MCM1358997.1 hypothetical protein [Corallococcus sp.]MCM1394986.1 hypothetical protein [Corallococcus sp.]
MKNAKRLSAWILVVALVVSLSVFAACTDKPQKITLENLQLPDLSEKEMVVVEKVGDKEYNYFIVPLTGDLSEKSTLLDVLNYIETNFDVTFDQTDGWINKFDKLANDQSKGEYVFLYTSVAQDFAQDAYVQEYDCDGVTVKTSNFGCAEMHLEYGCVIYITLITYGA